MSINDFVSSLCKPLSGARPSRKYAAALLAACAACALADNANAATNRLFEFLPAPYFSPVAPAAVDETSQASFNDRFEFTQAPADRDYLLNPDYRAALQPLSREPERKIFIAAGPALIGIASTYNPADPLDLDAGNAELASGERYDLDGWTAAIRTDLRGQFGGVRFGRNYVPTFALVQSGDKRLIVKINDVGPLRPGRIIDLNQRAMQYFDPTLQRGLIADVTVTPLEGTEWALGPIDDDRLVNVAGGFDW